jgi:sigma-B regulation protein RsbU (phosphoserine phosphatase)
VEQLLVIAKEKERLESEIEIARQVQSQLFPRSTPHSPNLRLAALCQPAHMVSGDYYDYAAAGPGRIAIAIGDVAGKGISAALVMAALQSSLRAQLEGSLEALSIAEAAAAGGQPQTKTGSAVSTSRILARINRQLHEATSPEKYATFFLGIYDEASSALTYTNAGHLPPILIRNGVTQELEINGTIVGAFPSVQYTESRVLLEPGDLLVCFTDGASEPENPFGEMFGEQRLAQVIAAHTDLPEDRIIATVLEKVQEWTGSQELPDDFTLLLARRIA